MNARPILRATALPSTRWALRRTPRETLARFWGISATRASHKTTKGNNELQRVVEYIEHPDTDGAAALAVLMEAWERRMVREACEDWGQAESRLRALLCREHDREAAQNRALQSNGPANEALWSHAADLLEIAARRTALGLERE